jgi:hypothetical protein
MPIREAGLQQVVGDSVVGGMGIEALDGHMDMDMDVDMDMGMDMGMGMDICLWQNKDMLPSYIYIYMSMYI